MVAFTSKCKTRRGNCEDMVPLDDDEDSMMIMVCCGGGGGRCGWCGCYSGGRERCVGAVLVEGIGR